MSRMTASDPRHGTENGYTNLGCHCDLCKKAHADYFRTGKGRERQRHRIESGLLKRRYHLAREAGYSAKEAQRRQFWSDPLAEPRS